MGVKVLYLKSPLKEKIYGGTRIQKKFGFEKELNKKIGEYWAISAHDNGPSILLNEEFKGMTLKQVYDEHRDLFANDTSSKFPLLVKINEITSPVSVQVHPNDEYAKKYANDLGKAEFCLFLDVEEGTKVIRGHSAQSKEEFKAMVDEGDWDSLFLRKDVKSDDYVYTPAGIIHGVEGKMMMAEVQQSSDVTYRIYDYDNVDVDGKPRELHIDKGIECTSIPHTVVEAEAKTFFEGENKIIEYIDNEFFEVTRYFIKDQLTIKNKRYSLCLVLSGTGVLLEDNKELYPGDSFVVTSKCDEFKIQGKIELLISEAPVK